jgi:hypothetical protein
MVGVFGKILGEEGLGDEGLGEEEGLGESVCMLAKIAFEAGARSAKLGRSH